MSFNGFDAFTKTSVYQNIIKKEALNLNIAFVCFYGSRNYNLETDKSDYDFFIVYYPAFENFYTHQFPRFSVIENDYDYFITPFHEYFKHALNGNVKFIEPIICGTVFENDGVSQNENQELIEKTKNFILMNFKKNYDAMFGIIKNKKLNVEKGLYTSNTLKYKDVFGYDIKEAINSLRIAFLLENYINTGEFIFKVKTAGVQQNINSVYKEFENYLKDINDKKIPKDFYLRIINKKLENIAGYYEKLRNKEEAVNEKRIKIKKEIEGDIIKICKTRACFNMAS